MKLTSNKLRKIILQELAELIIEPESSCGSDGLGNFSDLSSTNISPDDAFLAGKSVNNINQPDHEGEMARSQLERTAALSNSLSARMQDGMQLPAWVQAKITKAADYIQSVHNYLDDDLSEGKKKKKKKSPAKDYLYPYAYGIGRRPDYEEDEDDAQLDAFVFSGEPGGFGGGEGGGGE